MLRFDAHVHIFDEGVIDSYAQIAASDGITHFAAILDNMDLTSSLARTGATALPIQWIHDRRDPRIDPRAAGIKIHPREPLESAATFRICGDDLGDVCELAGRMGRPILIHTDADQPRTCTMPMLAELARQAPETTFVAVHAGVFPGPYFAESAGREYEPSRWRAVALAALRESAELLLDQPNLYADTTLFGCDDPARGAGPDFRFHLFEQLVADLTHDRPRALLDKLFIGTDFPCFWSPDRPEGAYAHQARRMHDLFAEDLDETRMAESFLSLLPPEFALRRAGGRWPPAGNRDQGIGNRGNG